MGKIPLIITESDRQNILSMYGLLTEVEQVKITIEGVITDISNNEPIMDLKVVLTDLSNKVKGGATTDNEGKYKIEALVDVGSYNVKFKPTGSDVIVEKLDVTSSGSFVFDKKIHIKSKELKDVSVKEHITPLILMDINFKDEYGEPLSNGKVDLYYGEKNIIYSVLTINDDKTFSENNDIKETKNGNIKNISINLDNYSELKKDFNNCQEKIPLIVRLTYDNTVYKKTINVCPSNAYTNNEVINDVKEKVITVKGQTNKFDIELIIQKKLSLTILDQNNNLVKTAKVKIYKDETKQNSIGSFTITEGKGLIKIKNEDETLSDVYIYSTADGYVDSFNKVNISNITNYYTIKMSAIGKININLLDQNKTSVSDATIVVKLSDGTEVGTFKTDENGKYTIPNSEKYFNKKLIITVTKKGYNDKKIETTIKQGDVTVSDIVQKIILNKIDFKNIPFRDVIKKSLNEDKPAFIVFSLKNETVSEDLFLKLNSNKKMVDVINNEYIAINYNNDEKDELGNMVARNSLSIYEIPSIAIIKGKKDPYRLDGSYEVIKKETDFSDYFNDNEAYLNKIKNII